MFSPPFAIIRPTVIEQPSQKMMTWLEKFGCLSMSSRESWMRILFWKIYSKRSIVMRWVTLTSIFNSEIWKIGTLNFAKKNKRTRKKLNSLNCNWSNSKMITWVILKNWVKKLKKKKIYGLNKNFHWNRKLRNTRWTLKTASF